jgi:maltose-binding protein MalE
MEGTGESAAYDLVTMTRYYSNFAGSAMQLYSWGMIAPLIVNLYEVEIATASTATPTAWEDTVITTTENLLKANTDHAVLGYTCDTALGGIALKGSDTSSFRYGGPGIVNSPWTPNYFKRIGDMTGLPAIPVFNSANIFNTFVSTIDTGVSTASNVTLHLAQLARNLTT